MARAVGTRSVGNQVSNVHAATPMVGKVNECGESVRNPAGNLRPEAFDSLWVGEVDRVCGDPNA